MMVRLARLAPLSFLLVLLNAPSPAASAVAAEPVAVSPGAAEPIPWLDEIDELRQRFEREMERMRAEFQREIERLQGTDTAVQLRRARARIEELERENAELRRAVRELRAGAAGAVELPPETGAGERPRGMLGVGLAPPDPELARGFGVAADRSVLITSVAPDSPAAAMGLRPADLIIGFDGREGGLDSFMEHMSGKRAGDEVVITYARRQEGGEILRITGRTALVAWREPGAGAPPAPTPVPPPPAPAGPISLGVSVEESDAGDGVLVTEVVPNGNAAAAKLQVRDRIVRFGPVEIRSIDDLRAALQRTRDGAEVALRFVRGDALWESRVRLSARPGGAALLAGPDRVGGGDAPPAAREPGFLGIAPEERDGGLVVAEVVPGSPAQAMGVLVGDRLLSLNETRVRTLDDLRSALSGLHAGDAIRLAVRRAGERHVLEGKLAPRSTSGAAPGGAPGSAAAPAPRGTGATTAAGTGAATTAPRAERTAGREPPRGALGVVVVERDGGVFVEELPAPSAAAAAGIRTGDRIRKLEGNAVTGLEALASAISRRRAGDRLAITVERDGRPVELVVTLFPSPADRAPPPGSNAPAGAGSSEPESRGTPPTSPPPAIESSPPTSAAEPPPRLGIEVEERPDGLWVVAIERGAAADAAGVLAGDRLLTLGGSPVTDIESMRRAVAALRAPSTAELTLWRAGREERVELSAEPR